MKLPVIVGVGGINAAGRSSGFHGYKRMVCDALSADDLTSTWQDLAKRMGQSVENIEKIKQGTLVRRIEAFDPQHVAINQKVLLETADNIATIVMRQSKYSETLAAKANFVTSMQQQVHLTMTTPMEVLLSDTISLAVSSAGSLPSGFDPGALYASHHHPRGLQLTVYATSDALNSLGFEWKTVLDKIKPDEVSVYAGSALSQIDDDSLAGLIAQPLRGQRINSKMMAMSLAEMPADFINSYIINSVGATGNIMGACASFLYNLKQAVFDIQSGKARVVLVGNSEAPLVPEIMEGFRVMGALATDESLCALDQTTIANHRRACRPFSTNTGFTLAESAQFVVLMDDELALELGATVYGSVADVFVNADANKKSIAGPGIGNYITVAKAAALAKTLLGEHGLQNTYVHAHGTGTPQNRTSESHIINKVAQTFALKHWPVTAIKSYVGHSVGAAGGDQLMAALGVWQYGWIPGIKTIDHIAADVHNSNLNILMDHHYVGDLGYKMQGVIINSKGFGGNNASCLVLSPQQTLTMLTNKYGKDVIKRYHAKNHLVLQEQTQRDMDACAGKERIIYSFGESIMDYDSMHMTATQIVLQNFANAITLPTTHPYAKYCINNLESQTC